MKKIQRDKLLGLELFMIFFMPKGSRFAVVPKGCFVYWNEWDERMVLQGEIKIVTTDSLAYAKKEAERIKGHLIVSL